MHGSIELYESLNYIEYESYLIILVITGIIIIYI